MDAPLEPPRSRRLLLVAYNGAPFAGFQQQDGVRTVADELDRAIAQMDPSASRVLGSSRTDTGVHARLQPITFDTSRRITARGWLLGLTTLLPRDIAVLRSSEVPRDFDPRRRPRFKIYRYRVLQSQVEDPFLAERAWRVGQSLNLELMQAEAKSLEGQHNFAAFRSARDARLTTERNLMRVEVHRGVDDARCVDIWVQGDRFLYNMVRIIAGTLVDVGRGRLEPGAVRRGIASGQRSALGMTAPARGLCLEHVELESWGVEPWPEGLPGAWISAVWPGVSVDLVR